MIYAAGAVDRLVELMQWGTVDMEQRVDVRLAAATALNALAASIGNNSAIAAAGGIEVLVELLSVGTKSAKLIVCAHPLDPYPVLSMVGVAW